MNEHIKLLYQISNSLKQLKLLKSNREFSSLFLNKCKNYLSSITYLNKEPSIRVLSFLLYKLTILNILPDIQIKLYLIIQEKLSKKMK